MRPRGVAVNMPPCHGGDRRFESDRGRHFFFAAVAQSVEQRTENPRVGGSIPSCGTMLISEPFHKEGLFCIVFDKLCDKYVFGVSLCLTS